MVLPVVFVYRRVWCDGAVGQRARCGATGRGKGSSLNPASDASKTPGSQRLGLATGHTVVVRVGAGQEETESGECSWNRGLEKHHQQKRGRIPERGNTACAWPALSRLSAIGAPPGSRLNG